LHRRIRARRKTTQRLRCWREVAHRIVTKLFDALLAAEEMRPPFEFDRSRGSVFVDGHAANGINRVSAAKMSMIVIHF